VADDLSTQHTAVEDSLVQQAAVATPTLPEAHRPPLYGKRFALAYVLLAVLLGTAVGLAVVLADDGNGSSGGRAWSEWKPSSEGTTPRLKEITDHVARKYRLDSGRQLVAVDAGPLAVQAQDQAVSVTDIAVRSGTAEGDVVDVEGADGAWMFNMCGLGERCSISEGEASTERHLLLRRQALELALYSFHYVDDVQSVMTFLPPAPDAEAGTVLYLKRSDLKAQLDAPLGTSLLPLERMTPSDVPPTETDLIDTLTKPRLYTFDFQQSPTGGAVMILDPAV